MLATAFIIVVVGGRRGHTQKVAVAMRKIKGDSRSFGTKRRSLSISHIVGEYPSSDNIPTAECLVSHTTRKL
jgi:hypothetical protein